MNVKTVTWNIGGGKHLKDGEDPLLMASYCIDAIQEIADWLRMVNPDIITLQEAQGEEGRNQVEEIAGLLGYEHFFFDASAKSHIEEGKTLGNGIISKHAITNHTTGLFLNPNISTELQGRPAVSHDKGYSACEVSVGDKHIAVATLHLLPFKAFGINLDSEIGRAIVGSIESTLSLEAPQLLIQGDFNIDSDRVGRVLPGLFSEGVSEIVLNDPTTPSGKRYDHVLYKGLSLESVEIDSNVKTDHYPVVCTFTVE